MNSEKAIREELPNGSGAAALLAAGIGAFALSVLAIATDQIGWMKQPMVFYRPTGPLSGVTTSVIVIWLVTWGILEWRWHEKTLRMGRIAAVAVSLLVLAVLLTFPPLADLI